jgi:hypothetical protein
MANFPNATVSHLVSSRSDHCPLLIDLEKSEILSASRKPWRYEMMWEREQSLDVEIERSWMEGKEASNIQDINKKLSVLRKDLSVWKDQFFGAVDKEMKSLKQELEVLLLRNDHATNFRVHEIYKRLDELLIREEIMWKQRSRIDWLREGDRNTKYFHQRATWRAKKNKIVSLKDENGRVVKRQEEMKKVASSFFNNLFLQDESVCPNEIINLMKSKLTAAMNESLIKDFSDWEIEKALFQIGPLKAPGPDGFHARFFHRNWRFLKSEVTSAIKHFFSEGVLPPGSNDTIIALIPKNNNAEELKNYRPISLCNVLYKIISKCLVNRLMPLMNQLISDCQSAFIPGWLITDNIITAYECLHFIKRNRAKKHRFCALKLDMRKAYDRLEWRYLEAVMLKLGFHRLWVQMVMRLVTTVSFQVLFNGGKLQQFIPSRGVRQGDPISPYMFLLVAEGLSCLLKHHSLSSELHGLMVAPSAPVVSDDPQV